MVAKDVHLRMTVSDIDNLSSNDALLWKDVICRNGTDTTITSNGASLRVHVTYGPSCEGEKVTGAEGKRKIEILPNGNNRIIASLDIDETNIPTSLTVKEMIPPDLTLENPNPTPTSISYITVDEGEYTLVEWSFTGTDIIDRDIVYDIDKPEASNRTYEFVGYTMTNNGKCSQRGDYYIYRLCEKNGEPAFNVALPAGVQYVIRGETWEYEIAPTNFGFISGSCPDADTFCVHVDDMLGWTVIGDPVFNTARILDSGSLWWQTVSVTVPCEAVIGTTNTVIVVMAFTDPAGICAPDCGDCEDPNMYGGVPHYSTTMVDFEVIESPPALYVMSNSLFFVDQGQNAAYIPFSICNGDPCAPPTSYNYVITSIGSVGEPINQSGIVENVPGGELIDIYGIIDAGNAEVGDSDELTLIAWTIDNALFDTCLQTISIIEPVPVPLFTTPVVTILVLAVILSSAVVMYRTARKRV